MRMRVLLTSALLLGMSLMGCTTDVPAHKPLCGEEVVVISSGMETPCDLSGRQSLVILYMGQAECLDSGGIWVEVRDTALCADVDH